MSETEDLPEKLARSAREAELAEFGPRAEEIAREAGIGFDAALEKAIEERRA